MSVPTMFVLNVLTVQLLPLISDGYSYCFQKPIWPFKYQINILFMYTLILSCLLLKEKKKSESASLFVKHRYRNRP